VLIEPQDSFLFSQEPAAGLCPEAHIFSPPRPLPIYLSFVLISISHVNLGLQTGFSLQDFGTELCVHFLHLSHAFCISLSFYIHCFDPPSNMQ
jgi:hypothetical protein